MDSALQDHAPNERGVRRYSWDGVDQAPACGPALRSAISYSKSILAQLARREMNTQGPRNEDLLIAEQLLLQSERAIHADTTPLIRRGELSTPIGVELTGRRWRRFQNWSERVFEPMLVKSSAEAGHRVLYFARLANRRGGRPEYNEAFYYLSFDPPCRDLGIAIDQALGTPGHFGACSPDADLIASNGRRARWGVAISSASAALCAIGWATCAWHGCAK